MRDWILAFQALLAKSDMNVALQPLIDMVRKVSH